MAQIENVPAPSRKPKVKISKSIRAAAKAYKEAYKDVYRMNPQLTFDGKWIRIHGQDQGVSLKRLKEMTTQLRNRVG